MAEFVDGGPEDNGKGPSLVDEVNGTILETAMIDYNNPAVVTYCPTCSMPPEYCEHGQCFEQCLPWIVKNCPEVLSDAVLAKMVDKASVNSEVGEAETPVTGDEKKKKKKGAAAPKKALILETKVVIARVQRQKRKFVTVVAGLETVPNLKIKDASRAFGRKFSSGASVNDTQTGAKEVVIQGDVIYDLPPLLMNEFKVPADAIFFLEDGELRRCS